MIDTEKLAKIKNVLLKFSSPDIVIDELAAKFNRFYELMLETNAVMNLTAITDFDEVLVKHFEDSLSLISIIKIDSNDKVLDLGTGAGFPGVPLALMHPCTQFTFLDSLGKRIDYLKRTADELGLINCEFVHGRAEDIGHDENYREQFSLVVSRAVADLTVLSEYALPFVKVGGSFVAYKSENVDEEVATAENAVKILGGEGFSLSRYSLESAGNRAFVAVRKLSETPGKYPRKQGRIKKNPLK